MTTTREMLRTSPSETGLDPDLLAAAIDALLECSQACTACADACLGEHDTPEDCVTSDLNCADVCATTARVLSRQTSYHAAITREIVQACEAICRECAEVCEAHAEHHEHCRVCAEACRRCQQACRDVLDNLAIVITG
jgi:hypothetical protein